MKIEVFCGLIVMICWGIADFIQSIVIRQIGTPKAMVVRNILTLCIGLCLVAYLLTTHTLKFNPYAFGIIFASSSIYVYGYFMYMRGLELGMVSLVAPIASSFSVMTVFLSVVILGEKLSTEDLVCIGIIVFGIFLLSTNLRKLGGLHNRAGLKEALLTMVFFGLAFFILSLIPKDINAINIFFYSAISQSVLFLALGLKMGGKVTVKNLPGNSIGIFLCHSILVNAGWFVYIVGSSQGRVSIIAPVSSVFSGVTVLLALVFYRERLVSTQFVGILSILSGIFILST